MTHLGSTVAALTAEDVAGETLTMRSHERWRTRMRVRSEGTGVVTEPEGQVFPPVDQPVESEDASGGGVSVGESQRHPQVGANGRSRRNL
jgi:hypothetical protein